MLELTPISSPKFSQGGKSDKLSDPTGYIAVRRHELVKLMEVVEQAARAADPELEPYILLAVTEDLSYTALSMTYKIPCGKDMYYDRYRKFFWVLSKSR